MRSYGMRRRGLITPVLLIVLSKMKRTSWLSESLIRTVCVILPFEVFSCQIDLAEASCREDEGDIFLVLRTDSCGDVREASVREGFALSICQINIDIVKFSRGVNGVVESDPLGVKFSVFDITSICTL